MRNFTLFFLALFMMAPVAQADFTDVTWDNIHRQGILYLEDKQVVSGYPDGSFAYDQDINRAEILKILIESKLQLEGRNSAFVNDYKGSCFEDVSFGDWFSGYVCYAKSLGWVSGFDGGRYFLPFKQVSLVEATKMSLVAFNHEYQQTDRWYRGVIDKAASLNILPIDVAYFHDNLTRGQMADLVVRTIKENQGSLDVYLGDRAEYNVSFDTLKLRENLYNSTLEQCKVPSILRMISQTQFNFQDGTQNCLTLVKFYTNSLDSLPDNFALTKWKQMDYYTIFYKTNIQNLAEVEDLLSKFVHYNDAIANTYDANARKAQYSSLSDIFYVDFVGAQRDFTVMEFPILAKRSAEILDWQVQEQAWRMEAEDRFDRASCREYNFPSFMMGKIKVFYEYCQELGGL